MNLIRKKLNSQCGASVILALLAFMTAAVVCGIIVNAAITNSRRIYTKRGQEQANLLVNSAALLIRDCILQDQVVLRETVETEKLRAYPWTETSRESLEISYDDEGKTNPLSEYMMNSVQELWEVPFFDDQSAYPVKKQTELEIRGADGYTQTVVVDLEMTRSPLPIEGTSAFELTAGLHLQEEAENSYVTLVFSAVSDSRDPEINTSNTFSKTVTKEIRTTEIRFEKLREARQGK